MFDIKTYGRVEAGELVEGPVPLPNSFRTEDTEILAFNTIEDPTLYGWWPWEDEELPEYDVLTQRLEVFVTLDEKVKRIVRGHKVVDLTEAEREALDPIPEELSTRQFFQQLAKDGDCSEDDALAYVEVGKLPQVLLDALSTLPAPAQFDVKMELKGANSYYRSSPNVDVVGWLMSKDKAALDRIWRLASKL